MRLWWTVQAIGPEQMVAEVPDTLLRAGVDDRGRCVRRLRVLCCARPCLCADACIMASTASNMNTNAP